jgi:transposase-like protein
VKKKNHLPPTPDDLTLSEIMDRFSTDEKAREYLESIRWPNGVTCPHCQNAKAERIWKIQANEGKEIRAGLYQCAECNKQFTCTVGTIFEDSHIPLRKWLIAWYLMVSSKKAISALQVQRSLGFGSYRTAWLMMHKIRHALADPVFDKPMTGIVEVDETYVGGKPRHGQKPTPEQDGYRKDSKKTPVAALVQRDGEVRTVPQRAAPKGAALLSKHSQYLTGTGTKADSIACQDGSATL